MRRGKTRTLAVIQVRSLLALALVNLSACVTANTHVGHWEYWDGISLYRLSLEQDGGCTLVVGGKQDGIGGRCRYSERNGSICIDEISALYGTSPPEKVACGIRFSYENTSDTIAITAPGEQPIRLVRKEIRTRP
jgi:hypothetical protein